MLIEELRAGVKSAFTSLMQSARVRQSGALCAVAGCLALAGLGAGAAHAQSLDNGDQRDFAFQAGVYLPSRQVVRQASADAIPVIEADYTIQKYPESNFNSLLSVSLVDHGGFRMIPITVSQIYRDPNNAAGVNYYYGVGLGLYLIRLNTEETDDRVKTMAGAYLVAGIDLTKTIFIEAKYNYIENYDNIYVGGAEFTGGIRF